MTFTWRRSVPCPHDPYPEMRARSSALLPGGYKLASCQRNQEKPTCSAPPITKCTKAACREGARNDSKRGDLSCADQTLPLPARFPARPAPRQAGFPGPEVDWGSPNSPVPFTGAREPYILGLGNYSTRGAQANGALELTRSGEGGSWRRKRQDLGQRA